MNACKSNKRIHLCNGFKRFLVHSGNDFDYRFKAMNLVSGIDPFRAVADLKVLSANQTGFLFKYRYADILRHAGIDR